jgi:hypothetical protein
MSRALYGAPHTQSGLQHERRVPRVTVAQRIAAYHASKAGASISGSPGSGLALPYSWNRERRKLMTEPILQAALKPEAAERYPFLPVRMWTAATYLRDIVAKHLRRWNVGRVDLPRSDFEFRWHAATMR